MYQSKNPIQQLAEYIKKNLEKGYTLDALRFSLFSQGYSKITVENALEHFNKELARKIPPIKEKPQITYKLIGEDEKGKQIEKEILVSGIKKPWWKRIF